jgi:hypothetical protein
MYTHSSPLGIGLAISLTANVMLFACLVGVFFLARTGAFAPANSSARFVAGSSTPTAVHSSTGTTPSPTITANWLQVAPTAVQLGCDGDQQMQLAILTNSGPRDVQWQSDLGVSADQAGINISPKQGNLKAGASTTIQIQTRGHSANQQGIIHFDPATPMAGSPPSLSYTTTGCQ